MKKMNLSLKDYKPLNKYSKFGVIEAVQSSNNTLEVVYYDINNKMQYSVIIDKNLSRIYCFLNTINDLQKKIAINHFKSPQFKYDLKEVFKGNVIIEKIEGDEANVNQAI